MAKSLKTRKDAEPYIRLIADRLRLRDWTFEVEEYEPNETTAMASIFLVTGRKFALIRFRADFLEASPAEQRHTVVHELIHAQFSLIQAFVYDMVGSNVTLATALEYGVDGLADAIAPLMPLPGARPK